MQYGYEISQVLLRVELIKDIYDCTCIPHFIFLHTRKQASPVKKKKIERSGSFVPWLDIVASLDKRMCNLFLTSKDYFFVIHYIFLNIS